MIFEKNLNFICDSTLKEIDFSKRLKLIRFRSLFDLCCLYHEIQFNLYLVDKYGCSLVRLQRLITIKLSLVDFLRSRSFK